MRPRIDEALHRTTAAYPSTRARSITASSKVGQEITLCIAVILIAAGILLKRAFP